MVEAPVTAVKIADKRNQHPLHNRRLIFSHGQIRGRENLQAQNSLDNLTVGYEPTARHPRVTKTHQQLHTSMHITNKMEGSALVGPGTPTHRTNQAVS